MAKDIQVHIQISEKTPNRIKTKKKKKPRYIRNKLLKTENSGRISKATRKGITGRENCSQDRGLCFRTKEA